MRARIDIGIDAIGDWRDLTHRERDFGEHFGFRLAFQIELENAKVQREAHFVSGLADTGENDLARYDACRHCPAKFARRYDIRSQPTPRSEEHTSELQSLMRISYAVFCLKKKKT